MALTETVLIKNNPLKMSAHMAVIEALMLLYIRELVEPARVSLAVKRFTKNMSGDDVPQEPEEALIYWVNESCQSLRKKLDESKKSSDTFLPKLTKLQDLTDFTDVRPTPSVKSVKSCNFVSLGRKVSELFLLSSNFFLSD